MRTTIAIPMLALLLLAACATQGPTPKVSGTACTMEYNPVCGENGITYGNPCMATAEGMSYTMGECTTDLEAYCADAISKVSRCGEYLKAEYGNLGGGTTWIKDGVEIRCPVVGPDSMSAECKELMENPPACTQTIDCEDGNGKPGEEFTACPSERQEACTKEYMPVCGEMTLNTGDTAFQTFGNKCEACAAMKVIGYTQGECPATKNYISEDLEQCKVIRYMCVKGMEPFTDEKGCGCQPVTEEQFIECPTDRPTGPVACTMDYTPVCAAVDNGIRCITEPCPSTDWKTYGNACGACADPKVAGYKPGECNPEVDNNPADDVVPPCAATLCIVGDICIEGKGCVPKDEQRFMICNGEDGYDRTQFAKDAGFTCVDECPDGFDEFGAQIGLMCIAHLGRDELLSWKMCANANACAESETCAYASHTTDGKFMTWWSRDEGFRCVPEEYAGFLINMGMTTRDENGQESTVIA